MELDIMDYQQETNEHVKIITLDNLLIHFS